LVVGLFEGKKASRALDSLRASVSEMTGDTTRIRYERKPSVYEILKDHLNSSAQRKTFQLFVAASLRFC